MIGIEDIIYVYPHQEGRWQLLYRLKKFDDIKDKTSPVPEQARKRNGAEWYYPDSTETTPFVIYYGTWHDELDRTHKQMWAEIYGSKLLWDIQVIGILGRWHLDSSAHSELLGWNSIE